MKRPIRILCFGDSNTWGYIPNTDHERYNNNERFPKVLQKLLGNTYEIIEEGLNSRTLISEDTRPGKEGRNGSLYLIPCLDTHDPLDMVILMLGTNELKEIFHNSAEKIGATLEKYFVKVILNRKSQFMNTTPKLLIISPTMIDESQGTARDVFKGSNIKSKKLGSIYKDIAKRNQCYFIDASQLKVGSDGVHMTKESHSILAKELYKIIKAIDFPNKKSP
jgi:lysophospholipase L1-like esterase